MSPDKSCINEPRGKPEPMSLVLVRVDCRLIHGQIMEAWVPFTKANCVVVANDEAAADPLQRMIMEIAVPPTVEVAILKVHEAARDLSGNRWKDKRVLLLFANCRDALSSYRFGLHFEQLNLGNLVCTPGKRQLTNDLSLDNSDMDYLREIQKAGVRIEARPVPRDHARSFEDILSSRRAG